MSQLILHPSDAYWLDQHALLKPLLLDLQFIQNKKINDTFLTGKRFLNLLTFMGCSPNIQIEFDKQHPDKAFCSVNIVQTVDPLLIVSNNIRPPKCPFCKKSVSIWQRFQQNQLFNCPHCQQPIQINTLNWKQQAGFAQTMIIIDNIYPQEAQPTPALVNKLNQQTGANWQYFYYF